MSLFDFVAREGVIPPTKIIVVDPPEGFEEGDLPMGEIVREYENFCRNKRGRTYIAHHAVMSDGTGVRIEANFDNHRIFVYPHLHEPENKFYVDTGWIKDTEPGAGSPTQASDRFVIRHTEDSEFTYLLLKKFLDKFFEKTFVGGEQKGKSYGKGISYAGLSGDAEARAKADDAEKLNKKLLMRELIGRCTGLLRCFVKGVLGRKLRETPDLFTFDELFGAEIGEFSFDPKMTGILIGSRGFSLITIQTTGVYVRPLTLPKELVPVWRKLKRQIAGFDKGYVITLNTKLMLATYLLAYASLGGADDAYFVEFVGGKQVSPAFINGWKFSLLSNKCVSVQMELVDPATAIFSTQTITFGEVNVYRNVYRWTATVEVLHEAQYIPARAPYLWVPIFYPSRELVPFTVTGFPAPDTSKRPIVGAYYDLDDKLVLTDIGCSSYTYYADMHKTKEESTRVCKVGTSTDLVEYSWGYKSADSIITASGDYIHSIGQSVTDARREEIGEYTMGELTLEESSLLALVPDGITPDSIAPWGEWCGVEVLGPIDFPAPGTSAPDMKTRRGWYGNRIWISKSGLHSGDIGATSFITPYTFADSVMVTEYHHEWAVFSGEEEHYYGIGGVRVYKSIYGDPPNAPEMDWWRTVLPGTYTGGGIASNSVKTSFTRYEGKKYSWGYAGTRMSSLIEKVGGGEASGPDIENLVIDYQTFVLAAMAKEALSFLPMCVHSLHDEVWVALYPTLPKTLRGDPGIILENLPIGAQ